MLHYSSAICSASRPKISRKDPLSIEGFRNSGIEGLKDKINKLKEIEFLQFLNP
jgi:hypothetical protein